MCDGRCPLAVEQVLSAPVASANHNSIGHTDPDLAQWHLNCRSVDTSRVTRRKHHRPGIAPNANTTHVPTAGSSAPQRNQTILQADTLAQKANYSYKRSHPTPLEADAHTSHVHKNAPARAQSPGGRPPSTCTHRTSQPTEVADATTIRTPRASCQLTGPMAPLPINQNPTGSGVISGSDLSFFLLKDHRTV